MTFAPRLEEITTGNFETATGIRVRPEQEFAVSPVMQSLAEAYVHPAGVAWPRLIVDGDRTVGFLMAFLDIDWRGDGGTVVRSGLWRVNIAGAHPGCGRGTSRPTPRAGATAGSPSSPSPRSCAAGARRSCTSPGTRATTARRS